MQTTGTRKRELSDAARRATILDGPQVMQAGAHFAGTPHLTLRSGSVPVSDGILESRTVYADLDNDRQSSGVLRQATWDVRTARQSALQDLDLDVPWPLGIPSWSIRHVWVDADWLRDTIHCLSDLALPMQAPKVAPATCTVRSLQVQTRHGIQVELTWNERTKTNIYRVCDQAWRAIWQQMSDLLQSGDPANPVESWCGRPAPNYAAPSIPLLRTFVV